MPDEVKNAKYATVTFTLKYKDKAFDNLARVGIKMTGNNGMFLSVWGPSQTENYLHVCVFGRDAQNDMFNGWDTANNGRVEDVRTALSGNGMQIRMVRASDKIRMFVYLNNAWVELVNNNGVATCEESAETDIRLLILKHEWEFSNIEYSALEHVEAKPASTSETGNLEHYKVGDMYFNTDGTLTTQDAITLPVLTTVEATLTVKLYKDGTETNLTGDVRFVNVENQKDFTVSVANGMATHTFNAMTYQLTYINNGDKFIGSVTITLNNEVYEITLQYNYATVTHTHTSGGNSSTVDLSKMNDSNHTVKITDNLSFEGTDKYTEVKLNLPDEVKNAKNVSVTFTLKYLGSGFNNLSRFGVKMAGECGIHAFVTDGNLHADTIKHGVNEFDGYNVQGYSATDFENALTGSTGLQVRVVRNGANIYMLVNLNGVWVRFTPLATCNESDVTDIRLLILAHEWEFSNIAYAATTQANVTHLGHNDTASVDLSKYDTDKTITMNDTKFDGTDKYTEAQLVLPDEVKNAKNVSVTFTLKHLGDFNAPHLVRFGVKMADGKGIFISMPDNSIQVCPIKAENAFDGYDNQNTQYSASVKAALMGDGLQVKVTRTGTNITMSVYLNGNWETFTTIATCKESDETDIRLLIMMYEWEFSNIEYTVVNNG